MYWQSKAHSKVFAHPKIKMAHADMSSAAAEVYAAGNGSKDFMHLSYVASELNLEYPEPIVMQLDNRAAEIFCNNTCLNSELKHIDVRQEWVAVLQNAGILIAVHVDSKQNLADAPTRPEKKQAELQQLREAGFQKEGWQWPEQSPWI